MLKIEKKKKRRETRTKVSTDTSALTAREPQTFLLPITGYYFRAILDHILLNDTNSASQKNSAPIALIQKKNTHFFQGCWWRNLCQVIHLQQQRVCSPRNLFRVHPCGVFGFHLPAPLKRLIFIYSQPTFSFQSKPILFNIQANSANYVKTDVFIECVLYHFKNFQSYKAFISKSLKILVTIMYL